jgi:hypothetical protein
MCLFALARSQRGAGTASGAASPTACRDATTAAYRATTLAVTTRGTGQNASPRDDHVVGLVTPLQQSNVDVVQRGHCCQQCYPRCLVRTDGLTNRYRYHEVGQNWSAVSAFKHVASRALSRLDPGPCSIHMMLFTPGVHPCWVGEPVLERREAP